LEEIQRLNGMLRERVATRESELETARRALRDAEAVVPASGLVGNSAPMREVHRLVQFAARAELPTLVTGESGTGKELAARALHSMGPRKNGPFVAENCAALPESLIESELFGAEKGAFTGADKSRPGLFERADGGTLFLDEIGELPIGLQAKLLRVLETGEVRRIGSDRMRPVDFRLVAATNRDLQVEAEAGRFRADLMYRLDAMRIEMPALATRVEDIPALVDHFMRIEASRSGVERNIAPDVVSALARRAWPGNVRELANEVSRLCALTTGDINDPDLVRDVRSSSVGSVALQGTWEEIERQAIEAAIESCGGDKNAAAKRLGISRAKVYQRWKTWRGED
jgi:two-component system response regulator HydG